jgi:hypothetical protein
MVLLHQLSGYHRYLKVLIFILVIDKYWSLYLIIIRIIILL